MIGAVVEQTDSASRVDEVVSDIGSPDAGDEPWGEHDGHREIDDTVVALVGGV